ncbi:MAG: tRNA (adenosine(37)-N6)-threonylcarbamoyltransferase complex transferase subunit TsaD [SAR86 cluster bacterium]|nr:tRNA (adenosine(37)-N6)-threonylcarbamoyltransferase complex transferase subunit TsaD [SAR86 cluster bacterium]
MKILGIETSCDETGVAIYDSSVNSIIAEEIYSQTKLHAKFGGVVPELASRDHVLKLLPLIKATLSSSEVNYNSINGIAYTSGPGLKGPLIVGASIAKALSLGWGIPSIGIHHMEAHLLINLLEENPPSFPFITLLISGGHCLLIRSDEVGHYKIIGQTLDDAVGEAFDKVARLLNLPYPGGPNIEKLARLGKPNFIKLPRPMTSKRSLDFSFSGLKTAVLYNLRNKKNISESYRANISASFQEAVADTLLIKCKWALEDENLKQLVIGGGVASNIYIRRRLVNGLQGHDIFFPQSDRCTDNGAMVAYAGYHKLLEGIIEPNKLIVNPRWSLEEI